MSQGHPPNIVVIGAGFSGLAAAWQLRRAGFDVGLLERRSRAGGQISAEEVNGFCLDHSLQIFHAGQHHLLSWIRDLGLSQTLLPLRPLQTVYLDTGIVSAADTQRLMGVANIPGLRKRDALRLFRWPRLMNRYSAFLDPASPEKAESLDFRSVADFVNLYFGSSALDRWVGPEVRSVFSGDVRSLSRVASLLLWQAWSTGQKNPFFFGTLRQAVLSIVAAATRDLKIRYEVEAKRIDESPGGGFVVECQGGAGGSGMLEADAVIIAASAQEARSLLGSQLSPAERDFLKGVQERPTVTLSLALDQAPTSRPELLRLPESQTGGAFDVIVAEPGDVEGRAPVGAGLLTMRASQRFISENAHLTDAEFEKSLLGQIESIFPIVRNCFQRSHFERRAAALPKFDVGTYRALARFRRVQQDQRALGRKIYYAGDYLIAPDAEGRVVSGFRAAQDFLADYKEGL